MDVITDVKKCTKCGEEKPLGAFGPRGTGRRPSCRACDQAYDAGRRRKAGIPERKIRGASSERKLAYQREYDRTRRHGLTRAQREAIVVWQGGGCPCGCATPEPELQVDHDHKCCTPNGARFTKTCGRCVRGLLCQSANVRKLTDHWPTFMFHKAHILTGPTQRHFDMFKEG